MHFRTYRCINPAGQPQASHEAGLQVVHVAEPATCPRIGIDTYGLRMCRVLHPNENGCYVHRRVSVGLCVDCGMRTAVNGVLAHVESYTRSPVETMRRHARRSISAQRNNSRNGGLRLRCGSDQRTGNRDPMRRRVGISQLYWLPTGISSPIELIETDPDRTIRTQQMQSLSRLALPEGKCVFEHVHYQAQEEIPLSAEPASDIRIAQCHIKH
jgi:hypothetical protein